jgi:hypothetical protein
VQVGYRDAASAALFSLPGTCTKLKVYLSVFFPLGSEVAGLGCLPVACHQGGGEGAGDQQPGIGRGIQPDQPD